jgi:THO complex subunit 4
MSEKLDQSLDQILSTQRRSARPGRGRRHKVNKDSTAHPAAPIGGVNKKAKTTPRTGKTSVPTGPSAKSGDGKIIVNNLVWSASRYNYRCKSFSLANELKH